jgi:hypothetical protein
MSELRLPAGATLESAKCKFQCPKISGSNDGGECTVDRSVIASDGEACHHDYQFVILGGHIVGLISPSNQIIWSNW